MNKLRGEVEIEIGGRKVAVVFGLGVLAEIEDELGIADFTELSETLSAPKPKMLLGLMRAILKGNDVEFTEAELKRLDVADVSQWLGEMMQRSAFAELDAGAEDDPQGKLLPPIAAE